MQKISSANREVVYSVRSGIPEGRLPSAGVLRSLISASSRKFGVDERQLHTVKQISEDLIKEVMDSTFISSATKEEYCEKLFQMAISNEEEIGERQSGTIEDPKEFDIITDISRWIGVVMGLVAGSFSVVIATTNIDKNIIITMDQLFKDAVDIVIVPAAFFQF